MKMILRGNKSDSQPSPENAIRFDTEHGEGDEKDWAIAIFVFSLCLVLFLWPLFSGQEEPRWDANRQFYPAFAYQADAYAEGRFPLWDPYTNCGYPFHAEPQHSTLSPVAVVTGFLFHDSGRGFVIYYLFLWWMAGIGTIWMGRSIGMHPAGGLAAALVYAFSGFFVAHAQHTPYICVAAGLPWVFGLATKSVAKSNWGYALLSGAALGLSSLGGYPLLVFFTGFALALWLPLWFLRGTDPLDQGQTRVGLLKSIAGTLCIVGAIAVLIWSPVLHAFVVEGNGYTDRAAPLSPDLANYGDPLTLPALFSLLFPYVTVLWGSDWMGADHSMTNVYIGAATIPLAFYWYINEDKKKRWGFLLFVALMFLTSLGGKAGVRILLNLILPPMRFMRFSAPFRLYWIFPMALTAGFGLSRLIRHPGEKRAVVRLASGWFAAGIGAAIILLFVFFLRLGHQGISTEYLPGRFFLPLALALPSFIAIVWIWKSPGVAAASRIPLVLALIVIAGDMWGHVKNNSGKIWGIETDSIRKAEAFHKRDTALFGEPGRRLPPLSRWHMNVQQVTKVPVVAGYVTMKSRGFDDVLCRSDFVDVLMSRIRFWLSPGAELSTSKEDALKELSGVGAGIPVPVFVSESPNAQFGGRATPGSFGKVDVRLYSPERVDLDVEVPGTRNAVLASTERHAAGWKARIDGTQVKSFRVNLYFRGIFVPPGRHVVTWEYDPFLWRPLVGLSLATLLASLAGGIILVAWRTGEVKPHW